MKLVEVNIIQKYHDSNPLPRRMTAIEACDYIQMSWQSWKRAIHLHMIGVDHQPDRIKNATKEVKARVLRRDHGVCHCCGHNMIDFAQAFNKYKKDPLRTNGFKKILESLRLSPKQRTFWYAEKSTNFKRGAVGTDQYRTTCFLCLRKNNPIVVRPKPEWAPTPIEGTWASKKAYYSRESIERFRLEREARGRSKTSEICPRKVKSKPFFKLYLARSVHNIYANWCRTRSRRYKEHFPGTDPETGRSWEDTLSSTTATQDTLAELHEAVRILVDSSSEVITHTYEEVIILLAKGCTPEDIVLRLGLPRRGLKTLALGA
jgi:DNA-directed RNA polymerase subunit N (RpoN/RPB10)